MKWKRQDFRSWKAFRWALAHEIVGPCVWIENEIDGWRGEKAVALGIQPGTRQYVACQLELREGFRPRDMPFLLRWARWLISDPLFWLSGVIYQDWEEDRAMMIASGRGPHS